MSYYAKIVNGIVNKVIVADASFFDIFIDDSPGTWIETYMDGSKRANYAGIGYIYDAVNDVFHAPQPFASWTIAAPTWQWTAPVAYPNSGGPYSWDETIKSWVAK